MASLEVNDTNIYDGLQLILSKFSGALMTSSLGCLHIPEALDSEFTQIEIDALLALGWQIDFIRGGWIFNTSGYVAGAPTP